MNNSTNNQYPTRESSATIPKSLYWLAGGVILLNPIGVLAYIGQVAMSLEAIIEFPEEQEQHIKTSLSGLRPPMRA